MQFERLEDRRLLAVLDPNYTETIFKDNLGSTPAALSVDPGTGDVYFTDDFTLEGFLRRVSPDAGRTLTTISSDFTPETPAPEPTYSPGTDIQFHDGFVYTVIDRGINAPAGELIRIHATTGAMEILATPTGLGPQAGLEVVVAKDAIYFTDGIGAANALFRYDLATGVTSQITDRLQPNSFSLQLNPADGKLYFARAGEGFFRIDEGPVGTAPVVTQISNTPNGIGNFAFDPLGEYIYLRHNGSIQRLSLATGVLELFATGLATSGNQDVAFGPSTSEHVDGDKRFSLYTGDGQRILEYSGFTDTPPPPQPGGIVGAIWQDLNGDRLRQPAEPAQGNVVVYLDTDRDGTLDPGEMQTTTNASGQYFFTDVMPGQYVVREALPTNYQQTSPGTGRDFYYGWDFSQGTLVKIGADTGNVTTLFNTGGVSFHGLAQTNSGQLYGLSGFSDSLYRINTQTGTVTVVGSAGMQLGFGLAYDPFEDVLYGLGFPAGGNPGDVFLVRFNLVTGSATPVSTALTNLGAASSLAFDSVNRRVLAFDNSDGETYAFDTQTGVGTQLSFMTPRSGNYNLAEDGAGNLIFAETHIPANFLRKMDPVTGKVVPFLPLSQPVSLDSLELVNYEENGYRVTVGSGEVISNLDFGNQSVLSSISGTKWDDLNGNGTREAGEPVLANVVVYVDQDEDGLLDAGEPQATTGPDGSYQIDGLLPGYYTVREVLPTNYRQTSPGAPPSMYWAYDVPSRRIVKVDPISGVVTRLGDPGSIGISGDIHGLAYTRDGKLYGINGVNDSLYSIDTQTGVATQIRSTGVQLAFGLAYDAVTDTIYGLALPPGSPGGSVQPVIFNRQTGGVTFVGNEITSDAPGIGGIAFDPVSRRLFAFDNDSASRELIKFDVTTGRAVERTPLGLGIGALADDGLGNLVYAAPAGLIKLNLQTFAITPFTPPLSNFNLQGLELAAASPFVHRVSVGPATQITGVNFGNQSILGDLRGTKFEDLDGDGTRDLGEPPMSGVVIYLDANNNRQLDSGELSTTTDVSGNYAFLDVQPGKHIVREVLPALYHQTSPGVQRDFFWAYDAQQRYVVKIDAASGQVTPLGQPGSIGVNVEMQGVVQTNDGQLFSISAQDQSLYSINPQTGLATQIGRTGVILAWGLTYDPLTDTIYGAAVPRGQQNSLQLVTFDRATGLVTYIGDTPTPGITGTNGMAFDAVTRTVRLYETANGGRLFSFDPTTGASTLLADQMSLFAAGMAHDGAGQLLFATSNQLVRFDIPTRTLTPHVPLSQPGNFHALEEVDLESYAHVVYLQPAGEVDNLNFGSQSILADLSGTKFEDLDGDGVRDAGEPAMAGIVIYLDANSNGIFDAGETSTTTDSQGNYVFRDVMPGKHVVREVLPSGYEQTSPGQQRDYYWGYDSQARRIVKVDAASGQVTPIGAPGSIGNVSVIVGMVQTTSGALFGIGGTDNALYRIDPQAGLATRIGSTGVLLAWGLTYDPVTDTIYGAAAPSGTQGPDLQLITIDPVTAGVTFIGNTPELNVTATSGMAFDHVTRKVLLFDRNGNRLFSIDPTTGVFTLLPTQVPFAPFGMAGDGGGQLVFPLNNQLVRLNLATGDIFALATMSEPVFLHAFEEVDLEASAHVVYVRAGADVAGLNFGNRSVVSSLSGVKFEDLNGDSRRQPEEPPLVGVTIYLDLNHDGQLSAGEPQWVTDSTGAYAFANLLPGRYIVREVVPEGFAPSPILGASDYLVGYDAAAREVVKIDPVTGAVTTLVGMSNYPVLHGIVRTNSGELYGLHGSTNTLFKIDPGTGAVSIVGSTGRRVAWGLAYDAVTDRIYGLAHPGADLEVIALAEYDRTTGEATIIGPTISGVRFTSGLTFDPVTRRIIAFDNSDVRELYAFDPVTGAGELLPATLAPMSTFGLAADGQGQLIVQAGSGLLNKLDPTTGQSTFYLQLSRGMPIEGLEFVDFASGGHDVYLPPRTTLAGLDFGNQILDVHDVGPVLDADAAVDSVAENAAKGTTVGVTAFATDDDVLNSLVTYALTDDADGRFEINAASGVVTVAEGSLLDREEAASYDITVLATSADGSSSEATFTIRLTDVDEFNVGSVSDSDATANSVAENATNGTPVGVTALASDADATNSNITYSLTNDAGGRFAIHALSGVISVANGDLLDREFEAFHEVTVRATSTDGSTSDATFTIDVTDVDEFDVGPVADADVAANSVARNATNGAAVGITARASDADASNSGVTYSLVNNADGRFAIDASSGVVTVADSSLLGQGAASQEITVRATSADGSTSEAIFTIDVTNVPPSNLVLDATEPALEGSPVTLTGSFDDSLEAHTVDILWDDGASESLNLAPGVQTFSATHPFADNRAEGYTVLVSVRDSEGAVVSAERTVMVGNVPPVASVSGPASGVRGFARTFDLSASDSSSVDQAAGYTYVINWGDGSPPQTITDLASTSASHVFAASGTFVVEVSATDKDGGTSEWASHFITIGGAALENGTLLIGGTTGADSINLKPTSATGIAVTINGVNQGTFHSPTQIQILGQSGNDSIVLDFLKVKKNKTYITAPSIIDGGSGNDTVDARGSTANSVLLGGDGTDTLFGGGSRNILIGGLGTDTLRAGNGDDILIGGTTDYDANFAALSALMAEWDRTNLSYQSRIDHLTGATSGGLNGDIRLTAATVHDDAAVDQLYGEGGLDWFLYQATGNSADRLRDRRNNERATAV